MNEDLVEDLIEELVEDLLEDLVEDLVFCLLYKFSWYSDFIDSQIEQYYLGYLQAEFVMTLVSPPLVGEDGLEYIFLFVSNGSSASWCLKANFATDKVTPVVVSTHGFVLPLEMFIGETIAKSPKLQERLSLSMMQYDDNNMRPCGA